MIVLTEWKTQVEQALETFMNRLDAPDRLREAMRYSLDAGGKRVRPALIYAVLDAYGIDRKKGDATAAALEMIHTYSLIHDDLPAMDDDDMRRGRPTNHIQFDEATAILAGDALLTNAFTCLLETAATADIKVKLIERLATAAGAAGMVGGQLDDMLGERGGINDAQELESIHRRKTGALLIFAVEAGGILAQATDTDIEHLKRYGRHLGIAFQIQDDILDVTGDAEKIGKPVGSDEGNDKATYPKLLGLDGAKRALAAQVTAANEAIEALSVEATPLKELLDFVVKRDH
ncbi:MULTISPECIES: polyprenyl synthetase family protein [Exiguobacterium]|uniref:Polyprenyl synthetase family protein n=1 Tax=Exiguobacterium antarcticum TaxID=132920 RepID=A0ABT6R2Y5_9BACL|nr:MULTISPECIES: farnesyl diphosphate synthase [Exiguobacterium]AFS70020.1 Polyprenyl synthetase [Exiguobacterium antarcticum B7]MCT4780058.1 polyprenyl synthetase family protein [Exiguobacterium soli]MDI3235314.1 polyprenyl synthetase family protein [Exiguobacterium antarcticum]